ncbi:MAG: GNAT family N-acetyltransferase [Candidatus Promineifilaceae bacterium]
MDVKRLSPPNQHHLYPPTPIPGVSFRLAVIGDLPTLHENCYPETNWRQFRDHFEYLLKWQHNGRCCILIAETIFPQKATSHELTQIDTNGFIGNGGMAEESMPSMIIGGGQVFFRTEMAEIAELSVHFDYRNRGIGTAIIHILSQIALDRKISILEIGVAVENQAALRLYRRLGFAWDRYLRLPDAQEAIILRKRLIQKHKGPKDHQ